MEDLIADIKNAVIVSDSNILFSADNGGLPAQIDDIVPIPGLLVAGADTGNVYKRGYGGGLAMALGFALQAVKTAGWIVPKVSNV